MEYLTGGGLQYLVASPGASALDNGAAQRCVRSHHPIALLDIAVLIGM